MSMSQSTTDSLPVKLSDYQAGLTGIGLKSWPGSGGTLWLVHEMQTMVRGPAFKTNPPMADELRPLFWTLRAPVVSYTIEPDASHPANAWLYALQKGEYDQEKLPSPARRAIRRAQKELRIEFVSWDSLLKQGATAYCDTRSRVGLSDGTVSGFEAHFTQLSRIPGHTIIGAWQGNSLVAFMSLVLVEDWVEIQGLFSANEHLGLYPNDGLFAYALDLFLIQKGVSTVSYGLSSAQQESNAAGLHRFKQKVGFQAKPVHRVFAIHPLLRPLVNPLSLAALETVQRFRPTNRRIKKATGMLDMLVNKKGLPDEQEKSDGDPTVGEQTT